MFVPFKGSALERYGSGFYVLCRSCREAEHGSEARNNVMLAVEQRIQYGRGVRA
jgi:hypothetical protein